MPSELKKLERRRKAKKALDELAQKEEYVLAIRNNQDTHFSWSGARVEAKVGDKMDAPLLISVDLRQTKLVKLS